MFGRGWVRIGLAVMFVLIGVAAVLAVLGQSLPRRRVAWPAGLTDREVEVLREVAQGRPNRAIAARLSISAPTVHTHVLNIYGKIGVNTRAGAAIFAMEHDLLRR